MPALIPAPAGPLTVPAKAPAAAGDERIRLSLVIPTFNEAANVAALVAELDELLEPRLGGAYELIVVDDDSADRTWETALGLCERHPRLRVVRRQGERGLSTAVVRGWQVARGEVLGVMDADLQHPPATNLDLLEEIDAGATLAVASRHVGGGGVSDWKVSRRVLSRGAQLLGLLVLPEVMARVSDPMSGYFMVRRDAIAGRPLDPLGYKILIEVIARGDVRSIRERGYVFRERVEGESKVTWGLYAQYAVHLFRLRRARSARTIRSAAVGAVGGVVDMSILYILGDPSTLASGLARSKVVAAEAAILTGFVVDEAWPPGRRRQGTARSPLRRLASFNAVRVPGLLLAVLLLVALVDYGGFGRYVANLVVIGVVTALDHFRGHRRGDARTGDDPA